MHLLREPVHLASRVDEDDSLCDCQSLVQITQSVQLPFLYGIEPREQDEERKDGGRTLGKGEREGWREETNLFLHLDVKLLDSLEC